MPPTIFEQGPFSFQPNAAATGASRQDFTPENGEWSGANQALDARVSMAQEAYSPPASDGIGRVNDYRNLASFEDPYQDLRDASNTCYYYGIDAAKPKYLQAISAADAIDQQTLDADRQKCANALAAANQKLDQWQWTPDTDPQLIERMEAQRDLLQARDRQYTNLHQSPATARANLGLAEIRSGAQAGDPALVIEGEQYIGEALRKCPEIRFDPHFQAAIARAATVLQNSTNPSFAQEGSRLQQETQNLSDPYFPSQLETLPAPGQPANGIGTADQPAGPQGPGPGDQPVIPPGNQPVIPPGDQPVVSPSNQPVVPPGDQPPASGGDQPATSNDDSPQTPPESDDSPTAAWTALLASLAAVAGLWGWRPLMNKLNQIRDYWRQEAKLKQMFGSELSDFAQDNRYQAEQQKVGGEIEIDGKKVQVAAGDWIVTGPDGKKQVVKDKQFQKTFETTDKPGEFREKEPNLAARGVVAKGDAEFVDAKGIKHTVKAGQLVLLNNDGTIKVADSPEANNLRVMPKAADAPKVVPNPEAAKPPVTDGDAPKPVADPYAPKPTDVDAPKPVADPYAPKPTDVDAPKVVADPYAPKPTDVDAPKPVADPNAPKPLGANGTDNGAPVDAGQNNGGRRIHRSPTRMRERIEVVRNADGTFGKGVEIPGDFRAGADTAMDADLLSKSKDRLDAREEQLAKIEQTNKLSEAQTKELAAIRQTKTMLADPATKEFAERTILQTLEKAKGTKVVAGSLIIDGESGKLPIDTEGGAGSSAGRIVIVGAVISAVLGAYLYFSSDSKAAEPDPVTIEGH